MSQGKIIEKISISNGKSSAARIAVVGSRQIAEQILQNTTFFKQADKQIIGFISLDMPSSAASDEMPVQDFPRQLGNIKDFKHILKSHLIEKILLIAGPEDNQKLQEAIQFCKTHSIPWELFPNNQAAPENLHPFSDASGARPRFSEAISIQRIIDLIISIIMLLVLLPSWTLISLAIWLESRRPILYSQERVGKDGVLFRVYKFRSMYVNAEKNSGPQLATRNDPRITRVGHFLRKTRLDELPQLINILKGDMTFIGPRPERPYFVKKYQQEIPHYTKRLQVKPGLTGFAQVENGYDETIDDVRKKVEYDLYFILHRKSIKLYLKILIKTVWVVLSARGQ